MKVFTVQVYSPQRKGYWQDVTSFIGKDRSGSFGIRAQRFSLLTVLVSGMATLGRRDGSTLFLGLPGGLLRFVDNKLQIVTNFFVQSRERRTLLEYFDRAMVEEQQRVEKFHANVHKLDAELLQRIQKLAKL